MRCGANREAADILQRSGLAELPCLLQVLRVKEDLERDGGGANRSEYLVEVDSVRALLRVSYSYAAK